MARGDLKAIRGGVASGDAYRLLNVPRFKAWNSAGLPGFGPGADYVGYNQISYDSDSMCTGSPYITCNSPGLYFVKVLLAWPTPVFTQWLWVRAIENSVVASAVCNATNQGISTSFGSYIEATGLWEANKGDTLAMYAYSNAAADIVGGEYLCYIQGFLASTIG